MTAASLQRVALRVLGAVLVLNAVVFTAVATNPYIDHDEWFFLKTVVIPFQTGDFEVSDLYAMRARSDHALPVQKLILLAGVEVAHMDYHFQAFLGIICALVFSVMLYRGMRKTVPSGEFPFTPGVALVLVLSVFFSINHPVTFSWPLLTLGYLALCTVLLLFVVVDQAINHGPASLMKIMFATALALVVGDDAGVLGVVCCLVALFAFSILQRRKDLRQAALFVLLLMLVYRFLVYAQLASYVHEGKGSGNMLEKGMALLAREPLQAYKLFVLPFANSVLHRMHFDRILGDWGQAGHVLFGLFIFGLHVAAWRRYITSKAYLITMVPCLLVLMSYLAMAGILVIRAPKFGLDYFNMPRYIRSYQLGMIGIIWMWYLRPARDPGTAINKPEGRATLVLMAALVGAAVFSAVLAWSQVPAQHTRQSRYANFLVQLAATPRRCAKPYVICRKYSPEMRVEMLAFLRDNELNVFKPGHRPPLRARSRAP